MREVVYNTLYLLEIKSDFKTFLIWKFVIIVKSIYEEMQPFREFI